jgi:hypothetical protein
MSSLDGFPEFVIGRNIFDRGTFSGRFRHFINVINPMSLSKTEDEIKMASLLLKESKVKFSGGIVDGYSNKGR